ncbi:20S proteasome subunit alpha 1 [Strigomonas culicis]|uniref:20S proteasome subunit alpha 1 n=1 Tax=Strigomonas culicis TaxID=28005 RepID=S9UVW9_9TRYP|nr:20S proteasome subunit alpha 1 [Strigomonas culicis]EPY34226.1 20S proteasome subunit alpha 1 [Strigomonas culicis]|eukprot:EPY32939.1 20S proteasome subunit alpha 1 [Strigomonas culicis]
MRSKARLAALQRPISTSDAFTEVAHGVLQRGKGDHGDVLLRQTVEGGRLLALLEVRARLHVLLAHGGREVAADEAGGVHRPYLRHPLACLVGLVEADVNADDAHRPDARVLGAHLGLVAHALRERLDGDGGAVPVLVVRRLLAGALHYRLAIRRTARHAAADRLADGVQRRDRLGAHQPVGHLVLRHYQYGVLPPDGHREETRVLHRVECILYLIQRALGAKHGRVVIEAATVSHSVL